MKKSNIEAIKLLLLPTCLGVIMFMTLNMSFEFYVIGQLCGILFFAQSFVLMHEFGHRSMFKNLKLNTIFGHFFSIFTFIPYYNWLEVHDLHHKWTGFRDKDPTTEKTFADRLSPFQVKLINFCWKYYIPIFTIGYRFGIYWKSEKLKRHLPENVYKKCIMSMWLYSGLYILLISLFSESLLRLLPAILMSFNITDIISMSQHSHIQMKHSGGENVDPLKFVDQVPYSRSLILPSWVGKYFILNMNFHEAHHAYPGLPCYHLPKIGVINVNRYKFFPWLNKVKSMNGVDFIFKSDPNRVSF